MNNQRNTLLPFIAVTSLFFMWGFITVFVDALVPRLREVFEISYQQSGMFQFYFFLAYFLLSIPAGIVISRIGYKKGILLGLSIMGLGCLLYSPAASQRIMFLFYAAFFIVAGGMTVLQVAANPYVSALGSERTASSRLNLAQAFNSLGTYIAPMLSAVLILSDNVLTGDEIQALDAAAKSEYLAQEAATVSTPFVYIAGAIFALLAIFAFIKLPKILGKDDDNPTSGFMEALKFPQLKLGALAIFVYVGAEVALGTFAVNYFESMGLREKVLSVPFLKSMVTALHGSDLSNVDDKGILGIFVAYYWMGAMIGRFLGSALTYLIRPAVVLSIFGGGAILMLLISFSSQGLPAMYSLLAVGLFNSIMFPTIFTLGIDGLGEYKPQGSGVLCSAIFGGAIIPPLFGAIVDGAGNPVVDAVTGATIIDPTGFKIAFFLPIVCYMYIAAYGFWFNRRSKQSAALA